VIRHRSRSQAGATLIEVLVASVVAIVIAVPMLSWLNTTLKATATVTDQLGRSNETGLLNAYFPRDVAGARSVTSTGQLSTLEDCGPGPGQDGRAVLVLISAGSDPQRIVYAEAPSSATGSATSLWRRTCDPTSAAGPVQGTELFRNITPGSTVAACTGPAGSTCGLGATRVAMSTTPAVSGVPVQVAATRRATDDSGGADDPTRPGSRQPIAKAVVTPFKGYRDTTFTIDARASINQTSGDPLTFTWTDPTGASCTPVGDDPAVRACTFASVGVIGVGLAASDGSGTGSATVNIEVLNRSPQAAAPQVDPTSVPVGGTITLTDTGSTDPDGDPLTWTWDLGDGFSPVQGQTAQVVVPEGVELGERQVRLTVADDQGGSDTVFSSVSLTAAGQPSNEPLITVSPLPVLVGGNPRPLLGGVGVGRTVSATFGLRAGAPPEVNALALFRAGGSPANGDTPFANCDGSAASCQLDFQAGDSGDFDLVAFQTAPGANPVERERYRFRIGRVPVASIRVTASGGDVPKIVTFTSADSTDPDGAIASRRWDFGCGNPSCTSTDVAPLYTFETPGTYTVTLTVTDADGLVSQATEVVEVAEL
jgi:PKD repeat protein